MAHGHRRIAFLGDRRAISTAADRRAGYRAALRAAGLPPEPRSSAPGLRTRDEARVAAARAARTSTTRRPPSSRPAT